MDTGDLRSSYLRGLRDGAPFILVIAPFAMVFGVLAKSAGLNVIEVKLRNSLYIEENTGELILSRNVQRLGQDYNAEAVLVGTYAQAQDQVFINVRLVEIANRTILGATSFSLPLTNDLRYLLPVSYR